MLNSKQQSPGIKGGLRFAAVQRWAIPAARPPAQATTQQKHASDVSDGAGRQQRIVLIIIARDNGVHGIPRRKVQHTLPTS